MEKDTLLRLLDDVKKLENVSVKNLPKKIRKLKGKLEKMLETSSSFTFKNLRLTDKIDYTQMKKIAKALYPKENIFELVGSIKEYLQGGEISTNQEFYDEELKLRTDAVEKLGKGRRTIISEYLKYVNS